MSLIPAGRTYGLPALSDPAPSFRCGGPDVLAAALQTSRHDTLATFDAVGDAGESLIRGPGRGASGGPPVGPQEACNPPLWELGHIGWFQDYWIARNSHRALGVGADPSARRSRAFRPDADALYDSSRVPQADRPSLPLPDRHATMADLERQLATTLGLLQDAGESDAGLYFFRLAVLHEDMHHEAALYNAQAFGIPIADPRWQPRPLLDPRVTLAIDAGLWTLGAAGGRASSEGGHGARHGHGAGFAFDNELPPQVLDLPRFAIDSRVLTWQDYLPFVEADGYKQPRWWTGAGCRWLADGARTAPRDLRRGAEGWEHRRWGRWAPLDDALPACHLTAHEAEAWCRWAGRRLPTEAEWEKAATAEPARFHWGAVWEWTSSRFEPYPGFEPHPYRDYSAPWFGSRRVLRGASFMTQPRLRDARYRNFFEGTRNDVAAGFRTCAATPPGTAAWPLAATVAVGRPRPPLHPFD